MKHQTFSKAVKTKAAIAALLFTCCAGLAACQEPAVIDAGVLSEDFSVADLEALPAVVRLSGAQAVAGTLSDDFQLSIDSDPAVVATFRRGDWVEYLGMTLDDLTAIRVGQGDAAVIGLIPTKFLWLPGEMAADAISEHYVAYTLLGAETFSDYACSAGKTTFGADAEITVFDEIDGVLIVRAKGDNVDCYMRRTDLTDELSGWTSRVDRALVNAGTLDRGAHVTILGRTVVDGAEYCIVSFPGEEGSLAEEYPALIPAWLVRASDEAAPRSRTGYAVYNAAVFADAFMTDSVASPEVDTIITVLDEFSGIAFVELPDGTRGYMPSANVTDTKNYVAPRRGGGGGGSSGGSGGGGSSQGNDGADISLMGFHGALRGTTVSRAAYLPSESDDERSQAPSDSEAPDTPRATNVDAAEGVILSPNTPVYWGFLDRDDPIHGISAEEVSGARVDVQLAGRKGWIDATLLRSTGDEPFTAATLYCQQDTVLYADYLMTQPYGTPLERNDQVTVVDEYGQDLAYYVVEVTAEDADESIFLYVAKSNTSETEIPAPAPRSSGGGGRSYGGGGGGGSLDWTDPIL